jgi:hypothetical protein
LKAVRPYAKTGIKAPPTHLNTLSSIIVGSGATRRGDGPDEPRIDADPSLEAETRLKRSGEYYYLGYCVIIVRCWIDGPRAQSSLFHERIDCI